MRDGSAASIRLFVRQPTTVAELSTVSGNGTSWIIGGSSDENLALDSVTHNDMAGAPEAARQVAERLCDALGDAVLPAGESDSTGRAVAIAGAGNAGRPVEADLLEALGLKARVDHVVLSDEARVLDRNYMQAEMGFCFSNDAGQLDRDGGVDQRRIQAATSIMAADLHDHFELNFSEEVACAPVMYGGRACDGNVVAVLSMRVWT
jgi:hypothetical protein